VVGGSIAAVAVGGSGDAVALMVVVAVGRLASGELPSGTAAWGSGGRSSGTSALVPAAGAALRAISSRAASAIIAASSRRCDGPESGQRV
jgi:hypothetical protein